LKRRIDARIKQRNLNIRTFWYNKKLMISKI